MSSSLLQEIIDKIDYIPTDTQYWFFRTKGGLYFDEFVNMKFIALGYDIITLEDVKYSKSQSKPIKALSSRVKLSFPDEKRPTYIARQIFDFVYSMKKGDIVLIPSAFSDKIAIGIVLDSGVYNKEPSPFTNKDSCPFIKRRRVEFIETIPKRKLEPNLFKIIFVHRTLTLIEPDVAKSIDRTTNTLFVKGERAHFVIRIESYKDLNAIQVFSAWLDIFQLAEEFGEEERLGIDTKKVTFKSNLNSPGVVELIGVVQTITLIALILVCIVGANVEFGGKLFFNFKIQSDGIIKRISQFISDKKRQKTIDILNSKLEGMELKEEDIIKLISQLNGKGEQDDSNKLT